MDVFFSLLVNLLPLYILIGMGFAAGRWLNVDRQSLASLTIYMFMPVVVFGFVVDLEFQPSYILLPLVIFAVSVITGLGFLALGKKVYADSTANLMAMCCSMGNTGYFGLPLVFLFFTKEQTAIYIFMMLGGSVYEATVGYYLAARGAFDVKTSLKKLIRFPALYAIAAGFLVNQMGLEPPELFWTYWAYFKGAYVCMGMMIVGAALSNVERLVFGPRFMAFVFFGKFVAWPVLIYAFVAFDRAILQWYTPDIHNLMLIMSLVPPAANIAAFAAQMNLKPEKAATTILAGTVFALLYIPAMIWLFGIQ
ncbi:MAG: AEC family transporter [Alphaproteobacteria bacterium]|nr:AEC family transporter [Alphaproteobacteria bacterium]MBP7759157.1 AEC family transporter [Alphaproteobacteria bacterium]MBP7762645.1 AEC family transporter [Alphaproteobacteria bacterium]MBP7905644.1 AEC family transporter [Alphaproteobacteria bacterium]